MINSLDNPTYMSHKFGGFMLKEIFVALKGGVSLFHKKYVGTSDTESQLISGFISALSLFASRVFGEMIREINFSTTKLVIQEISGKRELLIVCVTGLEIPLDSILEFQQKIGQEISNYILEYNLDPIVRTQEINTYIEKLLEEETVQEILQYPLLKIPTTSEPIKSKKTVERIIFIGLSKAGKTSIVEKFFNRKSSLDLQTIPPTMGMISLVPKIPFTERTLQIYDLGGHEQFLESHLQNESLFMNTLNLFFVIDAYDLERIDSALEYFNKILDIVHKAPILPVISIFLHKVDPTSAPIHSSIYWKLTQSLFPNLSSFNWAIYQTSIFSESLDTAMIESFLRSLPEEYLAQSLTIFTIEAIDILAPMTMGKAIKSSDIFSLAFQVGKNLGAEVRSKWTDYILESSPNVTKLAQISIFTKIERFGRDLKFSVTWPIPGQVNHSEFATIFQGLLTGILSLAGSYKIECDVIPLDINIQYCVFLIKHT